MSHLELPVSGMTCASCAARVERTLNGLDGVTATVNYATERATVDFDDEAVGPEQLVDAVESAGYGASLPGTPRPDAGEARGLRTRLLVSAVLAVPVLVLSMIGPLQFPGWEVVALVLATPVVLWGAWPFHRAAWRGLRHRTATMDTLISIGTLAAWLWSVAARGDRRRAPLPRGRLGGHGLRARGPAAGVAGARPGELGAGGAPAHGARHDAAVLSPDGTERRVPAEELRAGDRFVVRPGERVATDGVVEDGSSAVDASILTGESRPVEKHPGDDVAGGSVNAGGRLVVRATRVGADTALAQIARLVAEAQSGKARVQRLADRVSAVFVPAVVALAVATLVGWLVAGQGAGDAVQRGRGRPHHRLPMRAGPGDADRAHGRHRARRAARPAHQGPGGARVHPRVDTVLLDKTGTVTTGRMSLSRSSPTDRGRRCGSSARWRTPPSTRSARRSPGGGGRVRPAAGRPRLRATPGAGVAGEVGAAGWPPVVPPASARPVPPALEAARRAAEQRGATAVLAAWDDEVRAVLVVADTVKPGSADAVAALRALGLRPVLLTGDNRATAGPSPPPSASTRWSPRSCPPTRPRCPLQARGSRVAVAGDGVNDAPALAQADLGLAVGSGADVAIEASDLTMVSGDLRAVPDAIRLSRATLRTIRQNLAWAFAYNVAALPLAAAGVLSPVIAAAAMGLSSVSVVGNALRLRRFRSAPGR